MVAMASSCLLLASLYQGGAGVAHGPPPMRAPTPFLLLQARPCTWPAPHRVGVGVGVGRRGAASSVIAGATAGGGSGPPPRGVEALRELLRNMKPRARVGENIINMVAGATSAPIAQYIASPATFLHSLDPRIKQAWLLALVFLPSCCHMSFRIGVVILIAFISVWALPRSTWQDQLGKTALLSAFVFLTVSLGADGVPPLVQTRTPPSVKDGLPLLPSAFGHYSYLLWKLGPFQLTRKGLALGVTSACLLFTVLQSASLCLTTTMPEHFAAAFNWYLTPFGCLGVPVDEIVLTLLLSLRFVGLVFDEVRSIALGVVARGIQWNGLTLLETADIFFLFIGRVFKNLFNHAEQISQAMIARGFKGNAAEHKIYLLTTFSMRPQDYLAILALLCLTGAAIFSELVLC